MKAPIRVLLKYLTFTAEMPLLHNRNRSAAWCVQDVYHYTCRVTNIRRELKGTFQQMLFQLIFKTNGWIRAGTIRSSAVSIRIRYGPCRYETYSIRYTCTRFKVSKSRILDFNNKLMFWIDLYSESYKY